ncbi:MAG TPA: hypothetical protein VI932_06715 [Bacteroidota bacterium]|nr:hypothetical protein [Bacteroidota bacterium]
MMLGLVKDYALLAGVATIVIVFSTGVIVYCTPLFKQILNHTLPDLLEDLVVGYGLADHLRRL